MQGNSLTRANEGRDDSGSNVVALSRLNADVSRALARRGRQMLVADDAAKQIAALEPLETYFMIKELGVGEAAPSARSGSPVDIGIGGGVITLRQVR